MKYEILKPNVIVTPYHEKLYEWMEKEFTYEHVDDLYRAIESLCAPLFGSYPPDRETMCQNLFGLEELRDDDLVHIKLEVGNLYHNKSSYFMSEGFQRIFYIAAGWMKQRYNEDIHIWLAEKNEQLLETLLTRLRASRGFELRDLTRENKDILLRHYPEKLSTLLTHFLKMGNIGEVFNRRRVDWADKEVVEVIEQWIEADLVLPWHILFKLYTENCKVDNIIIGKYRISGNALTMAEVVYQNNPFSFQTLVIEEKNIEEVELIVC